MQRIGIHAVEIFHREFVASGLSSSEPLDEIDWLEEALKFASDDPSANLPALLSGAKVGPTPLMSEDGETRVSDSFLELVDLYYPNLRLAFATFLEARLSGVQNARRSEAFKSFPDPSGHVLSVHRFVKVGKELRRGAHLLSADPPTAFSFAAFLLLASDRAFGEKLCRCRLESCRKFFFERQDESGGQPGRLYCKREHMEEYHKLRNKERVRRSRERKKKAQSAEAARRKRSST